MSSSRYYYNVISSEFYNKAIGELFRDLMDNFLNYYVRNFGKFTVPIDDVSLASSAKPLSSSSIHNYLYKIVSKFHGFELIEASDKFYLFAANTLYFNVNWQIVSDSFEFSVIYGFKYDIDYDRDCAYVYCLGEDDDDRDTIIGCDESDIEDVESEDDLAIEGDDFDY